MFYFAMLNRFWSFSIGVLELLFHIEELCKRISLEPEQVPLTVKGLKFLVVWCCNKCVHDVSSVKNSWGEWFINVYRMYCYHPRCCWYTRHLNITGMSLTMWCTYVLLTSKDKPINIMAKAIWITNCFQRCLPMHVCAWVPACVYTRVLWISQIILAVFSISRMKVVTV